jgi:mannosyltransferase OCH1-like enzyme
MNFEDGMWKCSTAMNDSPLWKTMEEAYDKNSRYIHVMTDGTQENKIPKIIHQFWHGGPLPEKYKELADLWRKMHPDWEYMLWTEEAVAKFGLGNKWMYDNMVNPSAKSDVVRYEVVYCYGGVYVDTDFLPCKPLDPLLYLDLFCGIVGSYDGTLKDAETCLAPSIFGASRGNQILEKIIGKISQQKTVPRTIPEIMQITGPEMFSREVLADMQTGRPLTVAFPPGYFYPFPGQQRMNIRNLSLEQTQQYVSRYNYQETYAMHLWYCSWQKAHLL